MEIVLILLPLSLLLALIGLIGFAWCVLKNQYDDAAGAARRMLFDDNKLEP